MDQSERLLNLVALVMQSRTPVPKATILSAIEGYDDVEREDARERMFERDKATLAKSGLELRYVSDAFGNEGYVVDQEQSLLPPIDLTAEERLLVETIARSALDRAHGEFAAQVRSALFKLMFDNFTGSDELGHNRREPADDPTAPAQPPAIVGGVTTEHHRERATYQALLEAVVERKVVSFDYQKPTAEKESRTVEPYGLAYEYGSWYLAGRDRDKGEDRIFKLMRIAGKPKRVQPGSAPDFDRPADYDVQATVRQLVRPQDPDGQFERVVLRVEPDVAFMVREWASAHADDPSESPDGRAAASHFEPAEDGGGTLELRRPMVSTVWRILANYAPRVRVLEPELLRDRVRDRLTALRDRHAAQPQD